MMEFQLSYFKSWKMMLWKCCTQYARKFEKLSSGHRTGKGQFSFQSQRKAMPENAQSNCTPIKKSTRIPALHTNLKLILEFIKSLVRILEWVAIPFSRHLPSGVAWSEKEKKKYYTKSLLLKWRFSSWHLTGQSSSGVENNRKKDMAGKPYNTHPPFPCRID